MAAYEDLKEAVKETLQARGALDSLKARIRSEIFKALDEQEERRPAVSNENLIINELIREYLDYNGYQHSKSVFLAETSQPKESLDRAFLREELRIKDSAGSSNFLGKYGDVNVVPGASAPSEKNSRAQMNALFLSDGGHGRLSSTSGFGHEPSAAMEPAEREPKPVVVKT